MIPKHFDGLTTRAGAVDQVDFATGVSGWAVDPSDPRRQLKIFVKVEDVVVGEISPNLIRSDLSKVLDFRVDCGFKIPWCDLKLDRISASTLEESIVQFQLEGDCLEVLPGAFTLSQARQAVATDKTARRPQNVHDIIMRSKFFDQKFYELQAGTFSGLREAIEHYLYTGEENGFSPSPEFETRFYRDANPDISGAGNFLFHYVTRGRYEARYCCHGLLSEHAFLVCSRGLFDERFLFEQYGGRIPSSLSPAEYHISYLWRQGCWANRRFDDLFYRGLYEDASELSPIVHYATKGRDTLRLLNAADYNRAYAVVSSNMDPGFYGRTSGIDPGTVDVARHYLLEGVNNHIPPVSAFSPDYYLERYPDIAEAGIEPFAHFVEHGRTEGRVGALNMDSIIELGSLPVDRSLPVLAIITHEASRTGAPLLGYELGVHLSKAWNVVHITGRKGDLYGEMRKASCLILSAELNVSDATAALKELGRTWKVGAVLICSVEAASWVDAALYADIPSLSLINEFAEYTRPSFKLARVVAHSDRVVVPAQLVELSVQKEVARCFSYQSSNVAVRPQGHLAHVPLDRSRRSLTVSEIRAALRLGSGSDVKVVFGAGYVQLRKGIDLFIQTAAELKRRHSGRLRFVWVGDGYDPANDAGYSVWLKTAIERLDLEDDVTFIQAQSSLDTLFDVAHVFLLSSRLDPFPNVAVDAAVKGVPVVCFDRATGFAEMIKSGDVVGRVVGYCDVVAAAEAIRDILAGQTNGRIACDPRQSTFSFTDYVSFISEELAAARRHRTQISNIVTDIEASELFDYRFSEGRAPTGSSVAQAIRRYVALGNKGLVDRSPRPGLSEGMFRVLAQERHRPALAAAAAIQGSPDGGVALQTHTCIVLRPRILPESRLRVCAHIHLYYVGLAQEVLDHFENIGHTTDLVVTTDSFEKVQEIRRVFDRYGSGLVTVHERPNIGRDVSPFLWALTECINRSSHDIIGHFHGKRSIGKSFTAGDDWRRYLFGTLLPDRPFFRTIVEQFELNDKLGLVFAEDRHSVGWSENREIAGRLAAKLGSRELPEFPYFPLGTMFWARVPALEPLLQLGLDETECLSEPLPEDGSVLHAIERLLPWVCENSGHTWVTVYKDGLSWG